MEADALWIFLDWETLMPARLDERFDAVAGLDDLGAPAGPSLERAAEEGPQAPGAVAQGLGEAIIMMLCVAVFHNEAGRWRLEGGQPPSP